MAVPNEVTQELGQSKELVHALDTLKELREDKKAAAQSFRDRIDAAQKNIERIADDVRSGQRSLFPATTIELKPPAPKPALKIATAPKKKAKAKGGKKK